MDLHQGPAGVCGELRSVAGLEEVEDPLGAWGEWRWRAEEGSAERAAGGGGDGEAMAAHREEVAPHSELNRPGECIRAAQRHLLVEDERAPHKHEEEEPDAFRRLGIKRELVRVGFFPAALNREKSEVPSRGLIIKNESVWMGLPI